MGNVSRPRVIDIIPDEVKAVFELADIEKVFDELEKHFHTSKDWRKEYKNALKKATRADEEREVFAKFMKDSLDPSLKQITRREDSIIFSVMRFVVKDRINERRKEQRGRFSNNWK